MKEIKSITFDEVLTGDPDLAVACRSFDAAESSLDFLGMSERMDSVMALYAESYAKIFSERWAAAGIPNSSLGLSFIELQLKSNIFEVGHSLMDRILAARGQVLESGIKALENRNPLGYGGVYDEHKDYPAGTFVTWSGSLWHTDRPTRSARPGLSDSPWRLAVKRGKDGNRGDW